MTTSPDQCTCTIVPGDPLVLGRVNAADPMAFRIERCQLHAAAGLMRDALDMLLRDYERLPYVSERLGLVCARARAALAAADDVADRHTHGASST